MSLQPRDRAGDHDALLSVAQAAARLGVHPNTVRSWAEAGRLAAYRINSRGDRRFRAGDVERLLVEGAFSDGSTPGAGVDDEERDGRLAVLARLARGASASSGINAAARVAVEALRSDAGYPRVAIYLADGEGLALETHAGYRVAPDARVDAAAVPSGAGSVTSDRHGARAELPLRTTREQIGLLVVEDDAGGSLDDDLAFLRTVAAGVTSVLQLARMLTRARREVQRARVLRQVTQELTGQLDPNVVLADIVERTRSLFDADKAGLWLLGNDPHPLHLAAARGLGDAFLDRISALTLDAETLGVRAIRDRRPYWLRGADADDRAGVLRDAYGVEGIKTVCLVPLLGADEALGLLGLFHAHERDWPDGEVALVQAFANQAAVAIQNARLYRSVADQAARIRSIQDLSARLNRLTDVQAIADAIVAEAKTLAEYNDIRVYRVDWERGTCEPIAYTKGLLGHGVEDVVDRLRVPIGAGSLTGWVAEHGEALLVNDALHDPRTKTIEGTDEVEESMLVVPMLYEGRALGVIVLSQLGTGRFTNDDLQTMSIFAGYAAQAIANAAAYERLEEQSDQLGRQLDSQRRLLEINERLLSTLDQAAVLELIADGLGSVVAYDNLSIFRADPLRRHLTAVLAREAYQEEVMRHVVPYGRGLMGWVVEHGEPLLANDALADPRALQIPGTPTEPEAIIVVPLVADGEVIGAMNVGRIGREEVYFSAADFELVKLFAGQASIALRNADAHQAVNLRAETDALTGLANHGAFQRDLGRLLEATAGATGAAGRLSLLMMDLDSFKAYNDRLGHPAGDALLHAVGTAIYGAARSEDRVYRYGGDEFALILPGATVAEATRAARRIAATVRRLTSGDPTPVTITIGVASAPHDATDREGLLAAADAALYLGKQSGEDRVVRADEVPRDTLDLRGTLAELARAALRGRTEQEAVGHLVEEAARLSGTHEGRDSVRDALLAVARSLEARDTAARGHGDRVGRLAVRIAEHLGLDADRVRTIELAARLHALEDAGVTELDPIPSLSEVGALIRGYRALLQTGGRRTVRAARPRGPLGVHVVAVADAYDEHLAGVRGPRLDRRLALEHLRADPATLRSDVIDALAAVVDQRSDARRRRRRVDASDEERGAA